jgi:hypothetical protein
LADLAMPVPVGGIGELERDEHVTVWTKPPGAIRDDLVKQRPAN